MPRPKTPPADAGPARLAAEIAEVRGNPPADDAEPGAIGRTLFDTPSSEDLAVTVLLTQPRVHVAPSQSLVRIVSKPDGRRYLGVVAAGPFAEPDSLRADSVLLKTIALQDVGYLPRYHGRVQVRLLGEEQKDGSVVPPRLRPLPHSAVYLLPADETTRVLKADGDLRLGLACGHEGVVVRVPSTAKAVLPRHTAILGTTGGGKSTTVAGLVKGAVEAGMAVVLLDVEGEYTRLHEPGDHPASRALLAARGLPTVGVATERMGLYHLVGRETTNPAHPGVRPFALQFARLSPYTAMGLLECNDAQTDRYLFAYEVAKGLLRDLGIFPQKDVAAAEKERQERLLLRLDEFERGYPRLRLSFLLDVVAACKAKVSKGSFEPFNAELRTPEGRQALERRIDGKDLPGNVASWGKVHSLLWRMHRLKVFDRTEGGARVLHYRDLLRPGRLSVVDLSDSGMSELSNLAVADVLRGVQEEQDRAYRDHEAGKAAAPPRVLIVMEEAHEFLSADRVERTPHLFDQVARLAKRGRKRWLSLALVTQLPQHLPRAVLGLCNNFVLHKLTDPHVIATLKHTVSGVDDALWARLPGLAPGQAIVSMGHFARPILTAIDPTPCKLLMAE